jgi:hypothetical protein
MTASKRRLIQELLGVFSEVVNTLSDEREQGKNFKYTLADAPKRALAVFYFQHPSLLNFQYKMKRKYKRSNLETLFGVISIPYMGQMKNIIDDIDLTKLESIFDKLVEYVQSSGIIEKYRVLDKGTLIPVDGTWYYSSDTVHCDHCLTMTKVSKSGKKSTQYYHEITAAAIVKPGSGEILPLMPEFIRNEDGHVKQDCERNAAKRWLGSHIEKAEVVESDISRRRFICLFVDWRITSFFCRRYFLRFIQTPRNSQIVDRHYCIHNL